MCNFLLNFYTPFDILHLRPPLTKMTRTHQHRAYIELTFLYFGCLLAQREIQAVEQSEKKKSRKLSVYLAFAIILYANFCTFVILSILLSE